MNEQEAQEKAFEKWSSEFSDTLGAENFEDHRRGCEMTEEEAFEHHIKLRYLDRRTAKESWDAALKWAKQGQNPVAWLWPKERGAFICATKTEKAPGFDFWDKTPKPVYTHPAPLTEVDELIEILKGFASIINESDGVSGHHLNGAVADWDEFYEVNQLFELLAKLEAKK